MIPVTALALPESHSSESPDHLLLHTATGQLMTTARGSIPKLDLGSINNTLQAGELHAEPPSSVTVVPGHQEVASSEDATLKPSTSSDQASYKPVK